MQWTCFHWPSHHGLCAIMEQLLIADDLGKALNVMICYDVSSDF